MSTSSAAHFLYLLSAKDRLAIGFLLVARESSLPRINLAGRLANLPNIPKYNGRIKGDRSSFPSLPHTTRVTAKLFQNYRLITIRLPRMPLHPRSIGAGPYLRTASPDPAVNIALTAGLFALQPPIRIYAPYDRVSSVALKRLSILVVTGGVIKTALWNYRDIVFLKSPLDSDPVKFEAGSAGGFVVVRRGPGASAATAKYRKRRGGGQELAVGDALANISGKCPHSRPDIWVHMADHR